jgi:hypothetical protein
MFKLPNTMKKAIKKNWVLIGWIATFLIDQETGFVEKLVKDEYWRNFIYGVGALVVAYFWNSNRKTNKKEEE